MKSFKKIMCILLSVMMLAQFAVIGASAEGDYTIVNPYSEVIWEGNDAWGAYKGTTHTHTTYSDADDSLTTMIEEYYNQDYDFVAIADHGITGVDWDQAPKTQLIYAYQYILGNEVDHFTTEEYLALQNGTYPLFDGTQRGTGILPVLGANEFNHYSLTKNHVNGYFLPGTTGTGYAGAENEKGFETVIKYIDENGGISHINHPGDWINSNANPDVVNDPYYISFFGDLMLKYDSCLGMEVFNERNGTTGYDRILWDNLLMYCLPYGKTVIGYSNTDAHWPSTVDSSFSVFMMEENSVENVKKTMQNGAFFMVTRKLRPNSWIGPDEEIDVMNEGLPYPMFTNIKVDGHKITVNAKDCDTIQWIANGKVIAKSSVGTDAITLDLDTIEGSEDFQYVRAELYGEGGLTLSQAFVLEDGSEKLEYEEEELDFGAKFVRWFKGTKLWAIIGEIIKAF
ncbi:MAG: PHP domain-containing protein [Clostridia bacterium]|nr:PHP domain-containing protein [Clostridia bacterium]